MMGAVLLLASTKSLETTGDVQTGNARGFKKVGAPVEACDVLLWILGLAHDRNTVEG